MKKLGVTDHIQPLSMFFHFTVCITEVLHILRENSIYSVFLTSLLEKNANHKLLIFICQILKM